MLGGECDAAVWGSRRGVVSCRNGPTLSTGSRAGVMLPFSPCTDQAHCCTAQGSRSKFTSAATWFGLAPAASCTRVLSTHVCSSAAVHHAAAAAARYRVKLEACLPEVFVSFQATHKAADSRLVQEALRRAVLRLLRVWRDRFIFNDDYINGLQVRGCVRACAGDMSC